MHDNSLIVLISGRTLEPCTSPSHIRVLQRTRLTDRTRRSEPGSQHRLAGLEGTRQV